MDYNAHLPHRAGESIIHCVRNGGAYDVTGPLRSSLLSDSRSGAIRRTQIFLHRLSLTPIDWRDDRYDTLHNFLTTVAVRINPKTVDSRFAAASPIPASLCTSQYADATKTISVGTVM